MGLICNFLSRTTLLTEQFDSETHNRWLTDAEFKEGYLEDFNHAAKWINEVTAQLQKHPNSECIEHQSLTDLLAYTNESVSQMLKTMETNNPGIYQALYCDAEHDLKALFPLSIRQNLGM